MNFDQQRAQRGNTERASDGLGLSEVNLHIIDAIPTLAWCARPGGSNEFLNRRWDDYTGFSLQEGLGWGWKAAIHPDDLARLMAKWETLLNSGEPGESEARLRRSDGIYRWFLFRVEPLRDEAREVVKWYGTAIDIEDRKQTESLRAAEKRTLEMIADGASLKDVLNHLCSCIDVQVSPSVTTVLLMDPDGKRLWQSAGPLVPREWVSVISPVPVAVEAGLCGTAAFLKARVIVTDVATDQNWPDEYRDLAIRNGIRAAWSEPILTKDNQVLGTFALYCSESRVPTDADLALIEGAGHIALIAIERQRSQEALRKALDEIRESEAELRRITDAIPQAINVLGVDGRTLYANKVTLEYAGLGLEDVTSPGFRERLFHPEDMERVRNERQEGLAAGIPFELEQRVRRLDGQYRWFLIRYNPFRDEQGRVIRWYATGTDIDDRKQAEDRLKKENLALREEIDRSSRFEEIVGSSDALRRGLSQIAKVAPTDSTVLIFGETGTGKELVARAIHAKSKRATRAFIRVNCAAIPQGLIASELFGHEKGAFTGALQRRVGRFESADGGTLFLDEVGELPAETQIALLRVLQEHEFERVGGTRRIRADVRVIAATNRDLEAAIRAGSFRSDLFYRLHVFPIAIPPLRERRADISLLVEYFIDRYARKAGKNIKRVNKKTLELLQSYPWPGNIRELQNVIERSVILCETDIFSIDENWLPQQPSLTEPKNQMELP